MAALELGIPRSDNAVNCSAWIATPGTLSWYIKFCCLAAACERSEALLLVRMETPSSGELWPQAKTATRNIDLDSPHGKCIIRNTAHFTLSRWRLREFLRSVKDPLHSLEEKHPTSNDIVLSIGLVDFGLALHIKRVYAIRMGNSILILNVQEARYFSVSADSSLFSFFLFFPRPYSLF